MFHFVAIYNIPRTSHSPFATIVTHTITVLKWWSLVTEVCNTWNYTPVQCTRSSVDIVGCTVQDWKDEMTTFTSHTCMLPCTGHCYTERCQLTLPVLASYTSCFSTGEVANSTRGHASTGEVANSTGGHAKHTYTYPSRHWSGTKLLPAVLAICSMEDR